MAIGDSPLYPKNAPPPPSEDDQERQTAEIMEHIKRQERDKFFTDPTLNKGIPAAKQPHYNLNTNPEVPFVFCPVLQCPECWASIHIERIDSLRIRLRHTQNTCSRSLQDVIRPTADFVKFI